MTTNAPLPPYSKTRETDGLVFTSGHIGRDASGHVKNGLEAQMDLALQNLEESLSRHGLNRADVVRTTVYLAEMDDWEQMNVPYRAFFEEPYPARSTVSVGLPKGLLVEIDAIAGKRRTESSVDASTHTASPAEAR
ncbi:RidA family protein [Paenarthrobacter histidinolovorans]|uniref:RidA family protein n=1 Tax=Paenarthrobacter histidinolovorans TaxID=43664 RepID=UPI001667A4DE|nr:RidA family protein [Paenarthrobacter histidinolovorans]GGJ22055.1 RutC family protein [Paenarthrobacter histidinolovorans]